MRLNIILVIVTMNLMLITILGFVVTHGHEKQNALLVCADE